MSDTKIEWADKTWNPVTGCTRVSAGCAHCYAERMAPRFNGVIHPAPFSTVVLHPDRLEQPLHWRKPRRVFVCSMGDLFHEDVPSEFIASVFGVMAACPQHTFIVLTKRADRMEAVTNTQGWPVLPNVIGMVTAENQEMADKRIPHLLRSRFAVRGASVEPMLGPVDAIRDLWPTHWRWDAAYKTPEAALAAGGFAERHRQALVLAGSRFVDWVICGGESGPGARPMNPDWPRALRDQCVAAEVPFLFKQWGEWLRVNDEARNIIGDDDPRISDGQRRRGGRAPLLHIAGEGFVRVGKKSAGRLLDGREWDEYPNAGARGSQ